MSQPPVDLFARLEMQQWRDQGWINSYPLTVHSVYDYFKLSQFFRRDCNNEQLRQAGQDPSLANLRRLPGCEYQVREIPASGPGLQSNFLVYQQNRRDPDTVEVVQIFFVAGGTVFPMPTLHEVFSNQLLQSTHLLNCAFEELSHVTQYNSAATRWEFNAGAADAKAAAISAKAGLLPPPSSSSSSSSDSHSHSAASPLPAEASLLPERDPEVADPDSVLPQRPEHTALVNQLLQMLMR